MVYGVSRPLCGPTKKSSGKTWTYHPQDPPVRKYGLRGPEGSPNDSTVSDGVGGVCGKSGVGGKSSEGAKEVGENNTFQRTPDGVNLNMIDHANRLDTSVQSA